MSIRQKIMVAGALAVFMNFFLWIVFGDNGLVDMSRLQEKEQMMVRQNEMLTDENAHLYRIIQRLKNDPVYIESVARNELGMVGEDDLVIIKSRKR